MTPQQAFFDKGWCRFAHDPTLAAWVARVLPAARRAVDDPAYAEWRRYQGTWFVGVNALANDSTGAVADGPPLAGMAVDFIGDTLGLTELAWDRGQVSVCYPGYPQPAEGETEAAFRFRRDRDAAHVDGLLAEGPERRRHLRECHGFILGIPLVEASPEAAPVVVWEGSHEPMRAAFAALYAGRDPQAWGDVDVSAAYQAARREVFQSCRRVAVHARPGEAYILHRLSVHGIAPWGAAATAGPDGRMIVYFRPILADPRQWLNAP